VKIRTGVCVAALVAAMFAVPAQTAERPEDRAQGAADAWLKLTDAGDGGASWDQAAKRFQGKVTREQWTKMLATVRPPLGSVVSRKVKSRQYSEKLPGAPDAKYVTIRYETVFEKKGPVVETITPMLDPDGIWRVAGYVIR